MKMNGLHLSDRSVHFLKNGVQSLIVQKTHKDDGDVVTITINQKVKNIKYVPEVVKSFHASLNSKVPVRVIRGPIGGQYAPLINYRYDGLYTVEKYSNQFIIETFTLQHIFTIVRLPTQKQVYEVLLNSDRITYEIKDEETKTEDISEHNGESLSNVD